MCTVFAESEVISLVGKGEPRENIARGVIDSVVSRVCALVGQVPAPWGQLRWRRSLNGSRLQPVTGL